MEVGAFVTVQQALALANAMIRDVGQRYGFPAAAQADATAPLRR